MEINISKTKIAMAEKVCATQRRWSWKSKPVGNAVCKIKTLIFRVKKKEYKYNNQFEDENSIQK